ncbi:hypothetical protein ILYODFUR_016920 [Ilyodon furcidens]|uniref:Uncharacterized protein n=1 Tax=Ilyodon furcidens TaxID=33524 RepID=A0ABV0UKW8_9TELE
MEPYTVPGAQLSLSDLYSPFNVSIPGEAELNSSEPEIPVRSAGGMIIPVSITALYSVICVVGLLGNVLVMYGVVRVGQPNMKLFADTGHLEMFFFFTFLTILLPVRSGKQKVLDY